MGKLEVQSVKFIPPEWYDNREKFEKKVERMFDEMKKFVDETRENIGEQNKQISTLEDQRTKDFDGTIQDIEALRVSITTLSESFEEFVVVHNQKHESEKGILKKIFGR